MTARRAAAAATCTVALATAVIVPGCTRPEAAPDHDLIIIGAGIAGLSAALEAAADGQRAGHGADRRILVVDANSVGGGHAVKAGGFALVGTPLQARKGYADSPEIAARDILRWGEDADPSWVRRYVTESRKEVHDWLAGFGVKWTFILDTPEHSVPRFHFAGGGALNVVVPLMQAAFADPRIEFLWNSEVTAIRQDHGQDQEHGRVTGIDVRDTRTGARRSYTAPAVIIATGGWQGNLAFVRREWRADIAPPERLYTGAGFFATGSGIGLGRAAGAGTTRMDHQVTFTTGVPDPLEPAGDRALLTQNPAAIWVNSQGQRFINEAGPSKVADEAILKMAPATHWLIFDADGLRNLRIRDAVWLRNATGIEPLETAGLIKRADSLAALATAAGLPADALTATVQRWNTFVAAGTDADFGRFSIARPDRFARALGKAPWYAIQLFPMTRKSMGGLSIDEDARVLDRSGQAIPGLYAAGEVTGVAGINGSHGGEGTFLGPSVLLGRIAGRTASQVSTTGIAAGNVDRNVAREAMASADTASGPTAQAPRNAPSDVEPAAVTMSVDTLRQLIEHERPGYWHFARAHRIVLERELDCVACHSPAWPTEAARTREQRQLQLKTCATCH